MGEPLIDIRPDHWAIVRDILKRHVPEYEVWAFGSRATWKAKDYSDLDLAVITDKPLSLAVSAALADDFSESDLPWKVDVVDWATTSESFRKIIERDKVVVQEAHFGGGSCGWTRVRIGDVAEVFDGPHATPTKTSTGPVFLGIAALDRGRLDLSDVVCLSEDDFVKWTRRVTPKAGDVVFSYETKLGEAALIPEGLRCCLGRRMGLVRAKNDVLDSRYFLYQYLGPEFQAFLRSRTVHGSTVDRIPLIDFPDFPIKLPPIAEQRAIAHILGVLDDKIELNRRMNKTLEAIARAIFKCWFADFDPVRAKASGEASESICRRLGLTPDLLALFPNRLVDSEHGEMPEGWHIATIGELCERVAMGPFGSDIKRSNFVHEGVPVIRGGNLTAGFVDEGFVFVTEEKADELRNANARPGDIVITHRGTLGQIGLIPLNSRYARYVVSQSQMVLSADESKTTSKFIYEFLRSPAGQQALLANTSQVGVPAIARPVTSVKSIGLRTPPLTLVEEFESIVGVLYDYGNWAIRDSRTVASLRDMLLPKLLSGELRVPSVATA